MRIILLTAFTLFAMGFMVQAFSHTPLTIDLAEDHVDITTGFDGASLILYGTKRDPDADVAVVIRGPDRGMVVRRKSRVAGVWMNTSFMQFEDVPSYYGYALGPYLDESHKAVLDANEIGIDGLDFKPRQEKVDAKRREMFSEALIRNKKAKGLFSDEPAQVEYLNDHFFKTSLYIPANVPTGDYKIQTFVIRGEDVQETGEMTLRVAQVGLSATIYQFSKSYALAYGIICVLIAIVAGLTINLVRQRV